MDATYWQALGLGLTNILQPQTFLFLLLGISVGLVIGALPAVLLSRLRLRGLSRRERSEGLSLSLSLSLFLFLTVVQAIVADLPDPVMPSRV